MLPRLLIGDYLFVSKWNYGYSRYSLPFGRAADPGPHLRQHARRAATSSCSGRPPGDDDDVIKRVIGLPGDTIQMRDGHG